MNTIHEVVSKVYVYAVYAIDGFQNSLHPYALDESSLRIGRVNSSFHYNLSMYCSLLCVGG